MKKFQFIPIMIISILLLQGINSNTNQDQMSVFKILENEDIKKELISKLEEFATPSENLEEIFENKEQIEVSKFYEKLPKAHAIAIDNWLSEKIYHRKPEQEK